LKSGVGPYHYPWRSDDPAPECIVYFDPGPKNGIWCKRLYDDPIKGESTLLMRLDSGAASSAHSHENFEQIHVISGSFHDGERLMKAGDHCCRAPGAMHTSASDEGALVLVMYTPA
jgi:hypothetical protein